MPQFGNMYWKSEKCLHPQNIEHLRLACPLYCLLLTPRKTFMFVWWSRFLTKTSKMNMKKFLLTLQPHGHFMISWSLLQTQLSYNFFCAIPIESALDPFACCQKVNKSWSGRWMDNISLLSSSVCQNCLLTALMVTLWPLISQPLLSTEGLFPKKLLPFCLHNPRAADLCSTNLSGCTEASLWYCCFFLQKLSQSQWLCCVLAFSKGFPWGSNFMLPSSCGGLINMSLSAARMLAWTMPSLSIAFWCYAVIKPLLYQWPSSRWPPSPFPQHIV